MKRRKHPEDPFGRIREWQNHRYDPGYFTGGQIDPLLTSPRPNRYGWVLIITGLFFGAMIFSTSNWSDAQWWQWLLMLGYLLLLVSAGVKLLRRGPRSAGHRS